MKSFYQTTKLFFTLLTLVFFSDAAAQDPVLCESETCEITGFGTNMRAFWLPGLPGPAGINYYSTETSLSMDKFNDGTAHIYGDVYSLSHPDYGWHVEFWIQNKSDWDEWSALGRYWKGENEIVQDLYEEWDYYIVDESKTNQLTGLGLFEGSTLDLTHKPANYYYGFQMGEAANDQNAEFGFSCWFFYNGEVLGQEVNGTCDINAEGGCSQEPVINCLADVDLACGEELSLATTGIPELNCEGYSLTYTDTYTSDCPVVISREWMAANANGVQATCVQQITSPDLTAPEITDELEDLVVSEFPTLDAALINALDNCSTAEVEIVVTELGTENSDCGQFRTQTPGGWGAPANGNNPGVFRDANFDTTFPNGLEIGCTQKLHLTSASAVEEFLPSGGSPAVLTESLINPVDYNNTLAGHLVAITLTLRFDETFGDFGASTQLLKEQVLGSGTFSGWTVEEVVSMANQVFGGCSNEYSASNMVDALSMINENYVDGTINLGNLDCPNSTEECAETFSVVYTATDDCGNTSSTTQIISVQSGETFSTDCPEDITVECSEVPDAPVVTFSSECGSSYIGVLSEDVVEVVCQGNYIFTRTWSFTTDQGETVECSQQITVVDTTPPVFINAPEDVTVECGNIPEVDIEAVDNCALQSIDVQLIETQLSGNCFPVIQRTFIAEDLCGNVMSHIQYITVIDTQAPEVVNPPEDLTLNCGDEVPVYQPIGLDNCSEQLTVTYTENHTSAECGYELEQVWILTDNCNNSTQVDRVVFFEDNTPPELDGTLDEIITECVSQIPQPNFYDDCGSDLTVSTEPETLVGCGASVEVVYTVSDNCGNTSQFTQMVTVVDTEPPVMFLPNTSVEVNCEELAEVTEPEITDCNEFTVSSTDVLTDFNEGCATLVRTWIAEDMCGNVSSIQQEIVLIDNQAPVFLSAPEDFTATCTSLTAPEMPEVADNCNSNVEITFSAAEVAIECGVQITRVWTAVDACGNTAEIDQVVTVIDEEAPVITGDAVIEAECGESLDNLVTAEDDCADFLELTFTDVVNSESSCLTSVTRTYVATDPCGNTAEFVQEITFTDTQAPEISPLLEVTIQCQEDLSSLEIATAIDNCSAVDLTFVDETSGDGCLTNVIRTYTATDACGNTEVQVQNIIIQDTQAPEFTTEVENSSLNCGDVVPAAPEVTATDNCSEVEITFTEEVTTNLCPDNILITRTWTATDACFNSATLVQTIALADTDGPVFDQNLEDIIGECGGNYPVPEVTASDACSADVEITFSETTDSGGCPNIIRTWTAKDACGNATSMIQTIFIEDTEPPVISGVQFTLEATCENLPDLPIPTVVDNCDENVDVTISESITGTGCEQILIRMWIATDDCGNTTIATQSINLIDEAPPVFLNPIADNAVECDDLAGLPLPLVEDNCGGDVTLTYTDEVVSSGCEGELIRTFTASDLCGNTASFVQNITIIDLTPPVISGIPPGTFVNCGAIPEPVTPTVMDNCNNDGVVVEFNEEIQGGGCSATVIRTWTATDVCGNTSTASRYIFMQDTEGPVFMGAPEDEVLNCNAEIPPVPSVAAVDVCSGQTEVSFLEEVETNDCGTLVTRTWSATDDCGNTSVHTQTIEITDLEAPELVGVPENTNANCGMLPPVVDVTAVDNCSDAPQVSYREEIIAGECPYQILRIWTATDACGNSTEGTQTIFVTDNEAPVFLNAPEDVTLTCSELEDAQLLVATDGCVSSPEVMVTEEYIGTGCDRKLLRTWTAVDYCGNATEHTQEITLIDTEAPEAGPFPSELTVECTERPEFTEVEFTDDCNEVSVTFVDELIAGECLNTYDWVRNWTATDLCGNTVSAVQTIHVVDTTAPSLNVESSEVTVTCDRIPALEQVAVFGECGDFDVVYTEEVEFLEELDSDCTLGNASSLLGDVAIWLPDLSASGSDFVFGEETGTFSRDHATGEITITGQVYNVNNSAESWIIDLRLYDSQNWEQWSANGGSYKDDMDLVGDEYLNWEYLKLSSESTLIGAGEYAGSELYLTHTPADYTYGFQIGQGANNRNGNFGISGWFFYQGMLDGNFVFGNGDLIADLQCCPDQDIVREWTATDCAGNSTTVTQIIHVRAELDLSPLALYALPENDQFDVTNSAGEEFVLTFDSGDDQEKTLVITDTAGRIQHSQTYSGLEKNTEYTRKISKNEFQNGMYMFYLQGKTSTSSDKELKLD